MSKLTEKQKAEYLKAGGVCCPYCGSGDICGSHVEIEYACCFQNIRCSTCGKEWTDIYKLVNVEEVEI